MRTFVAIIGVALTSFLSPLTRAADPMVELVSSDDKQVVVEIEKTGSRISAFTIVQDKANESRYRWSSFRTPNPPSVSFSSARKDVICASNLILLPLFSS